MIKLEKVGFDYQNMYSVTLKNKDISVYLGRGTINGDKSILSLHIPHDLKIDSRVLREIADKFEDLQLKD